MKTPVPFECLTFFRKYTNPAGGRRAYSMCNTVLYFGSFPPRACFQDKSPQIVLRLSSRLPVVTRVATGRLRAGRIACGRLGGDQVKPADCHCT
jgi:hypothetical protein